MTALYPLTRVKPLISGAYISHINATSCVARDRSCGDVEARRYIRVKLSALTPQQYTGRFVHTSGRKTGQQSDVYRINDAEEELHWYVKISIEKQPDGEVLVVSSFHEPER